MRVGRELLGERSADPEAERQELARAAEALKHAHKMDAIGHLASGIAHDFNNVLMGVLACVDMASYKLDDPDAVRRYLEEIRRAATTGAAVVGQLMAFARKEGAESEPVALDPLVRRTEGMLGPLIGEDVTLELSLGAGDAWVRAPRGQLEQVLLNLSINARDAMPGGGHLRVETSRRRLAPGETLPGEPSPASSGEWVSLVVSDSGHGMDERTRARVFEPFFTTKAPERGTGLGLSTVYGIVQRLGGHVAVESEPDRGTTFRIHLPAEKGTPRAEARARTSRIQSPGRTVLVVEDDPRVRLGVAGYLERAGHRVIEAENAADAWRWIEQGAEEIDLLVSDVVLPGGASGVQLAGRLAGATRPPAVLFMSAHSRQMLDERSPVPPDVTLLEKPFGESELLDAVGEVLAQRELTGPPPERAEGAPARWTILVVEDRRAARNAIGELLEERGHRVLSAANAREAQRLSREHGHIDLVLSDVGLPDLRGTALAQGLREGRPELAVLLMSGTGPEEDPELAGCLGQPRTAYAPKPLDLESMLGEVRRLMAVPRAPEPGDGV